jgi:transcription antitermination factor NusG
MNGWYIIQTKPKKEATVQRYLAQASYEVFLPLMKGLISPKVLFPSYLFVRTNLEDPHHHRNLRFARGVTKILSDSDGPQPIAETIVETLRERTLDGSLIEQDLLFKEGDEVTVKKGILRDLRGIIEKNLSDRGRVKVLFKWMSSSMRAVLRYTDLEKAA